VLKWSASPRWPNDGDAEDVAAHHQERSRGDLERDVVVCQQPEDGRDAPDGSDQERYRADEPVASPVRIDSQSSALLSSLPCDLDYPQADPCGERYGAQEQEKDTH
jgi:hypothetical protein